MPDDPEPEPVHVEDTIDGHRLVVTGMSDRSLVLVVCRTCRETLIDRTDLKGTDVTLLIEVAVENHL